LSGAGTDHHIKHVGELSGHLGFTPPTPDVSLRDSEPPLRAKSRVGPHSARGNIFTWFDDRL
jgi:hypothetical protein